MIPCVILPKEKKDDNKQWIFIKHLVSMEPGDRWTTKAR